MPTTPTPADRPADQLRAAVARALVRYDWNAGLSGRDTPSEHHYGEADAVLAVLPAHALAVARQLLGTTTGEGVAAEEQEPVQLRWGLDDVMYGDDDSTTVLLSGPGGEPYWVELDPERTAALRDALTGPTAPPAPADWATVRDRIRRAICEASGFTWLPDELMEPDEYGEHADAVLAVLDAPADRAAEVEQLRTEMERRTLMLQASRDQVAQLTADRAAILRERADFYDQWLRDSTSPDSDPRYCQAVHDIALGLRRLAGEAAAGAHRTEDVEDVDVPFGSPDCACVPWTRQGGTKRLLGPADTVDQISGWEKARDCPHHAAPAVPAAPEGSLNDEEEFGEPVCVDECGSCDVCGYEVFGTPAEGWREAARFLRRTARDGRDRGVLRGARFIEDELRHRAEARATDTALPASEETTR